MFVLTHLTASANVIPTAFTMFLSHSRMVMQLSISGSFSPLLNVCNIGRTKTLPALSICNLAIRWVHIFKEACDLDGVSDEDASGRICLVAQAEDRRTQVDLIRYYYEDWSVLSLHICRGRSSGFALNSNMCGCGRCDETRQSWLAKKHSVHDIRYMGNTPCT